MTTNIIRATVEQLDLVADLFNQYRVFYGQDSDLKLAHHYINERLYNEESVVFLAVNADGEALGFTQLYPIFSSVSAQRSWILNDLFVTESGRSGGVGRALMNAATQHAIDTGANGLSLETAHDNLVAQSLYESLGYKRETAYFSYFLSV
ncbi:GNAT family N-acetyltransferase [Vibrio hepatarius]|uniref:GNAT family N-acetyltransferase n=1 Tax=Vibrio hepatarius TaxID=171383 RepID=UPI00373692EF